MDIPGNQKGRREFVQIGSILSDIPGDIGLYTVLPSLGSSSEETHNDAKSASYSPMAILLRAITRPGRPVAMAQTWAQSQGPVFLLQFAVGRLEVGYRCAF